MKADSLRNVLTAIYRRRGRETDATKLFENWPPAVQEGLVKSVVMRSDELPVLASVQGGDRWLLITTQRIVDCRPDKVREIDCSLLKNLDLALFADRAKGAKSKDDVKHLRLVLTDGRQEIIEVEPGQVHNGVWNLLIHFATLNAKKPVPDRTRL